MGEVVLKSRFNRVKTLLVFLNINYERNYNDEY